MRWSPLWFYRMVRTGGTWDYKTHSAWRRAHGAARDQFEDFGNFHYGAVGAAFGIPWRWLLRGAGWEQWRKGRSQPAWGTPWGRRPYGDDPADQLAIILGIGHARHRGYRQPYWSRLGWRVFDIVVALVGLAVSGQTILLMALATMLDSGWPPLNGSWRLGRHGKPFRCWKIRTLKVGHEAILEKHLAENETARHEWATYAKFTHDPRTTRIGHLLRRTSLDEVPQLWNLLRGEMAVWGPRAFLVAEHPVLGVWAHAVLQVKPGFLSYYGAYGRARLTVEERVKLDAKYARRLHKPKVKWTALVRTVGHCLKRTGAG